eukprot:TRINITY_DN91945_c0_g1_i1.p1 TRINITY_DN91945_c0_g1~~TRINITY_DN91945_c0_g1_i1.p1  ORF type:complete len:463 (-),score=42.71 TRINITY_DN91945_c0_g1_i1:400-1737(-)
MPLAGHARWKCNGTKPKSRFNAQSNWTDEDRIDHDHAKPSCLIEHELMRESARNSKSQASVVDVGGGEDSVLLQELGLVNKYKLLKNKYQSGALHPYIEMVQRLRMSRKGCRTARKSIKEDLLVMSCGGLHRAIHRAIFSFAPVLSSIFWAVFLELVSLVGKSKDVVKWRFSYLEEYSAGVEAFVENIAQLKARLKTFPPGVEERILLFLSGSPFATPEAEAAGPDNVEEANTDPRVPQTLYIQDVEHSEPAAQILPEEGSRIALSTWHTWVEHHAAATTFSRNEDNALSHTAFEKVLLLRMTRNPPQLENVLHFGPELETIRNAMREAGCQCLLPSGASIFVHPAQYTASRRAVASVQLRPYHIVVAEAFAPLVLDALRAVPSRRNVRLREHEVVAYLDNSMEGIINIIVERTFLNIPRALRGADSVTQSTTEAHGGRNPRRFL